MLNDKWMLLRNASSIIGVRACPKLVSVRAPFLVKLDRTSIKIGSASKARVEQEKGNKPNQAACPGSRR